MADVGETVNVTVQQAATAPNETRKGRGGRIAIAVIAILVVLGVGSYAVRARAPKTSTSVGASAKPDDSAHEYSLEHQVGSMEFTHRTT